MVGVSSIVKFTTPHALDDFMGYRLISKRGEWWHSCWTPIQHILNEYGWMVELDCIFVVPATWLVLQQIFQQLNQITCTDSQAAGPSVNYMSTSEMKMRSIGAKTHYSLTVLWHSEFHGYIDHLGDMYIIQHYEILTMVSAISCL